MKKSLPPLNALRAFEAASRHMSFVRAAEELHVTATAISHQIKTIEDHLGVRLFNRERNGISLTASAKLLLPGIRDGFKRLSDALGEFNEHKTGAALRILVPPSFGAKWLRPRIGGFRHQYPEIEVCVSAYRLLRKAELNNFDFVITYGPGNFPSWHAEKFLSVEAFPVCSPALLRAKHPLRTPADLAHHTLLHDECSLSDSQSPDWGKWLQLAGADNVDATRGPTFTPGNLALDAAIDGSGVALAKGVLVEDDLATGRLIRPFEVELKLDFAYWLHYPTTLDNSYRVNALRRWLNSQTSTAAAKEPAHLPPKVVVQVNESAFLS